MRSRHAWVTASQVTFPARVAVAIWLAVHSFRLCGIAVSMVSISKLAGGPNGVTHFF
jgi:hypothetical protein